MDKTAISSRGVLLTERDIELFRYLNEQKFMVSGQIYQIFWPECDPRSGAARQRLTKLVEAGYLKIIEVDKDKLKLFLLTEKGIDILKERRLDHKFAELSDVNPLFVQHTLKLVNIRALFRELGQHDWRSERLMRKEDMKRGWYPDGMLDLYGLKVAFELENSFRSKDRYVQRFKKYESDNTVDLAVFVVSWHLVKSWLLDLEGPQDRICFVLYDDLLKKKGDAELENKTSKIVLKSIL